MSAGSTLPENLGSKLEKQSSIKSESQEANSPPQWNGSAQHYLDHPALIKPVLDPHQSSYDSATVCDVPIYVEFEDDDPENPFNWSKKRKWLISGLGIFFTFIVAYAGSSYPIGIPKLEGDLHVSTEIALLGLSFYPLGFGVAPLILAPLSEVYGRSPMYIASTFLFTAFTALVGGAPNIYAVCWGRFLSGCAGSTGSTMVGGSLADVWIASERGLPMAIFSAAAFIGTGLGPAISGYLAQNVSWRWIQWLQVIIGGVVSIAFLLLLRETRGTVILSKRAAKLRKQTGDSRYQCKADEERASLPVLIKVSLTRPLWFLISEPVVTFFSIWVSFAWGVMYGLLEAIPLVMQLYGANLGQQGLAFLAIAVGGGFGLALTPLQESFYRRKVATKGPEARLYGAAAGGLLLSAGCMIFAWTSGRVHWIAPLIGVAVLITGTFMIYVAVFSYLADCYMLFASSAIAAQSFGRNVFGTAFPLFTTQMYKKMTYEWASFFFGMVALLLAAIPFVLLAKGPEIRTKSKVVQDLHRILEEKERERAARSGASTPAREKRPSDASHDHDPKPAR